MWQLWRTASETHSRPSDLVCVEDRLVAYLFDSAVTTFGRAIENALMEEEKVGTSSQPKYTLMQLLSQDFKLPRAKTKKATEFGNFGSHGIAQILAASAEGTRGIRRWEYQPDQP